MAISVTYTNGVIAANEKYLLKDKLARFLSMSAEDAFRLLIESGFGGGEHVDGLHELEKLVSFEERKIDAFIQEYAPSQAEKAYLLSERDFHNAKALLKAKKMGVEEDKLLSSEGLVGIEILKSCVENGDYSVLEESLRQTCEKASELLFEKKASPAAVGEVFEKGYYAYLLKVCKHKTFLKKAVRQKIDMLNLLAAFRSEDESLFARKFIDGGKLKKEEVSLVITDREKGKELFKKNGYADFFAALNDGQQKALSIAVAERALDSYETDLLFQNKYELKNAQPFLYYVFRRRAECANVRIIFVCLSAGLSESEIKKRLRSIG